MSKATAVIRRLSFTGTVLGGAYECIPAPNGKYAPALSSEPQMCEAGKNPDVESAHCELCEEGYYSPEQGDNCKACPEYTFANEDRTACIPYDIITDQRDNMHHLNKLMRPDVFCATQKNQNICDEGKREIGPIALPSVPGRKSQKVFFLSNRESLMTEMYDFHRSKLSPHSRVHQSYVYMLYNWEHAPIDQLREFISDSTEVTVFDLVKHENTKNRVDHFRIQRSLGTQIESITNIRQSGYTVNYHQGDTCQDSEETQLPNTI